MTTNGYQKKRSPPNSIICTEPKGSDEVTPGRRLWSTIPRIYWIPSKHHKSSIDNSSSRSTSIAMSSATFGLVNFAKSSLVLYSPSSSNILCRVVADTPVFSISMLEAAILVTEVITITLNGMCYIIPFTVPCPRGTFRILLVHNAPKEGSGEQK